MSKLDILVARLGAAYDTFKAAEKALGTSKAPSVKQEFLNEATALAEQSALATKTVIVSSTLDVASATSEAAKRNPRWALTEIKKDEDGWHILMTEDPSFKPFTYVDRENKRVWAKQVVDGSPWLDEETLQDKNPRLWEEVTEEVRVLKDLATLESETMAELQDYIYPGKPVVKLAAPKKAKAEDLE